MVRETWVQSQVESYQRLKKWYLIFPCLTFSIIRYVSKVIWNNPGKGVAPSPTPRCSSYRKGSLQVALDYYCIAIMISITTYNTNTGGMNEFISFYLQYLMTRGERHKSEKPMLTILYWPHPLRTAHFVVSEISVHLCRLRPKLICFDQTRKTQPRASTVIPQLPVKILKFSGSPLPGMTSTTRSIHSNGHPALFPVWGFIIIDDDFHILSVRA